MCPAAIFGWSCQVTQGSMETAPLAPFCESGTRTAMSLRKPIRIPSTSIRILLPRPLLAPTPGMDFLSRSAAWELSFLGPRPGPKACAAQEDWAHLSAQSTVTAHSAASPMVKDRHEVQSAAALPSQRANPGFSEPRPGFAPILVLTSAYAALSCSPSPKTDGV